MFIEKWITVAANQRYCLQSQVIAEVVAKVAAEIAAEITAEVIAEVLTEAAGRLGYHSQIQLVVLVIQTQ